PCNRLLGKFFELFNRGFLATANFYSRLVGGMLRVFFLVFLVYVGLIGLTYQKFHSTPRGFIPSQDMGYLLVNIQLPDSASIERTKAVIAQINKIAGATEDKDGNPTGVAATVGVAGQSLLLNAYGSNFATMFVTLQEFSERRDPELYYEKIMERLRKELADAVPEATISIFGPPPVRGVGRAGGWMLMIEDRGDLGPMALQKQVENLVQTANPTPAGGGIDDLGNIIPVDPPKVAEAGAGGKDKSGKAQSEEVQAVKPEVAK